MWTATYFYYFSLIKASDLPILCYPHATFAHFKWIIWFVLFLNEPEWKYFLKQLCEFLITSILTENVTFFYPCNPYPTFCTLTILREKDWCFTQFSTGMAGWLLLIFLICLHNQLSSIHPLSVQMFEKCNSSNRQ